MDENHDMLVSASSEQTSVAKDVPNWRYVPVFLASPAAASSTSDTGRGAVAASCCYCGTH